MKSLYKLIPFTCFIIMLFSCNNKKTLQGYLVESHDKKEFVNIDLPIGVFEFTEDILSEEDKDVYESVKKISLTALPIKKSNETSYEKEKTVLKSIFEDSDYKKLISYKKSGNNINIYYSGEANRIGEIIAFGYGKDLGIGVARILGEEMNPSKIISLFQKTNLDFDGDSAIFEKVKSIFTEQ